MYQGIQIAGVTEMKVESTEQIMNLIFLGNRRRTTEATNANQTSSRSHAVFQIFVSSSPRTKNTELERTQSKLSLIDLAGSERGTVTENRGIRLREGAKINRSLLALANCINALGDKTKKGFFVPYRDSKLTRLLKDSLGGNSRTVMIANISPAGGQIEETLNTLKYASRAKNIKTKAVSNKKLVSLHVAEYRNIISDLRQEIEQLKSKMHDGTGDTPVPFEGQFSSNVSGINQSPSQGKDNQCPCYCGRAEDDMEMKKVQTEIFENFQERIQLRRALMELEEQNALNYLEIKRKQAEIMVWRKKDMLESQTNFNKGGNSLGVDPQTLDEGKRPLSAVPNEIKLEVKNIHTLRMSTDKNTIKREVMNLQLAENIGVAKQIRDSIPRRIRHQDKKEFLEMVIKNHVLELQNIELEIHLQIQDKTINDLKNIIHSQKKVIDEHKIDSNIKIPWDEQDEILSDGMSNNDSEEDTNIDDIIYNDENEIDNDEVNEEDEADFEAMEYKDIIERNKAVANTNASVANNNSRNPSTLRGRSKPKNGSITENQVESSRSRADSKSRRVIGHEENKETKVLENNYVIGDNEQENGNNSPRAGYGRRPPANMNYGGSNVSSANKNDISVISSLGAIRDQSAQQKVKV